MSELQFVQTRVMISLTGKAVEKWPCHSVIESVNTLELRYVESLANYFKLPLEVPIDRRITLKIERYSNEINLQDDLRNKSWEIKNHEVKLFEDGYFVFTLEIHVPLPTNVEDMNEHINNILKDKNIVFKGENIGFVELSKTIVDDTIRELNIHNDPDNVVNIVTFETYTTISPACIQPDDFNTTNVIGSGNKYEYDLYEAAIRRMPLSGVRMDLIRKEQKNVSLYDGNMVYLNYHNLFVYIASNISRIKYEVYVLMMDFYKVYVAKLNCILKDMSKYLKDNISDELSELQAQSDWIESTRLRQLRAYEQFRNSLDVSSTRIKWFKQFAVEKFCIEKLTKRLNDSLDIFEKTISRRVLLKQNEFIQKQNESIQEQNKSLQKLSNRLTILSVVVSAIGVFVAIVGITVGVVVKSNNNTQSIQSQNDKINQTESINLPPSDFNTIGGND